MPYVGVQFVAIPEFQGIGTEVGQDFSAALAGSMTIDQALAKAQASTTAADEASRVHQVVWRQPDPGRRRFAFELGGRPPTPRPPRCVRGGGSWTKRPAGPEARIARPEFCGRGETSL